MPLLPTLSFASTGLRVACTASAMTQDIAIDVVTAERSDVAVAAECFQAIVQLVNEGAAGGDDFPPELGVAELVQGPAFGDPGPRFSAHLRWSHVSGLFLRNVVERLAVVGGGVAPVLGLSIVGSLPPDGTRHSVTTADVLRWLDDILAYPARTSHVPFALDRRSSSGAALHVDLADEVTPEHHAALDGLVSLWLEAITFYVRNDGRPVYEGPRECQFQSASGKHEYRARVAEFQHVPGPSADALVNLLARFHAVVAPLRRVEIRL